MKNQGSVNKLKATKNLFKDSNHEGLLVCFLEELRVFHDSLSNCESIETLFDFFADFFIEIGYDSLYVFNSKMNEELDLSLHFQKETNADALGSIRFSEIHPQIKKSESATLITLEENNEGTFVWGFSSLSTTSDGFLFYIKSCQQVLSNEAYGKLFGFTCALLKEQIYKVENDKKAFEALLAKKNLELDRVVETLSQQYIEMKCQHDKQVELIKEIHHRVNNNLQVISSLLNLYSSSIDKAEKNVLEDIRDRVQVMALIHLNAYKSLEMNLIDYKSYLQDLFSYLRSVNTKVRLFSNIETDINTIKLDTLVPLGLLITEVVDFWLKSAFSKKLDELVLDISVKIDLNTCAQALVIKDHHSVDLLGQLSDIESGGEVSLILLSALIEQLDGEFQVCFTETNEFRLIFMD